jgi:hypothetical protein
MSSQRPGSGENRTHWLSYSGHGQFRERAVKHRRLEDENQLEQFYNVGRTLGRGSFGVVKEAVELSSSVKWAVKIITKEKAFGVVCLCLGSYIILCLRFRQVAVPWSFWKERFSF